MKVVDFIINTENVSESLVTLSKAITGNTEAISSVMKANKRLAFSVICLSGAGYLTYRLVKKQAERIEKLEQTVNTLVQIAVGEKPQEQQQTEE